MIIKDPIHGITEERINNRLDNIELINLIESTLLEDPNIEHFNGNYTLNLYTFEYNGLYVSFKLIKPQHIGLSFFMYNKVAYENFNIKDIESLKKNKLIYTKFKNALAYYEVNQIDAGNIVDSLKTMLYIIKGIKFTVDDIVYTYDMLNKPLPKTYKNTLFKKVSKGEKSHGN